ncbi:MAG TPA: HyaD/HybD family hydrogenase maturation endopeptidase [Candidatus Dormibacteraeota bacterium]|nr:HyaD/HybD family hydrogenase maturation endopeptidase [Candidatus Dormibacteraeota bacterium]
METNPAQNIMVVGVGNTIHSDDGAGIHALERLQRDPRLPPGVSFLDGGTFGIELLVYLQECTRLLLLDAVDVGEQAGTLVYMTGRELRGLPCGASVHQLGLADLLATLPLVSEIPREIVLLGVQPSSTDWGTELSAPVEAAMGPLVEAAIEQLLGWSRPAVVAGGPGAHADSCGKGDS